jgi:hypothetical protein
VHLNLNEIMISCQTNQLNKSLQINCIIPTCEELNYETSQVKCPHREKNFFDEKCQKIFKNIMALNVHLQMYHKQTGIITVSEGFYTIKFYKNFYLGI